MVYYIYNRGSIIYDLYTKGSEINFIVIVSKEFIIPDEFEEFKYDNRRWRFFKWNIKCDNCDFTFFTTDEWFSQVTRGSLEAWECACLPKKFVHKEHVKLLMTTDPLQLRKDFEERMNLEYLVATGYYGKGEYSKWKVALWKLIKDAKFVNQIIQNHKIINFKEANSEYEQLVNNDCIDEATILKLWLDLIKEHVGSLNKATDGMLKKEREKKILQNEK